MESNYQKHWVSCPSDSYSPNIYLPGNKVPPSTKEFPKRLQQNKSDMFPDNINMVLTSKRYDI